MTLSYKHSQCNVYALHGFLGLPSDWDPFPFVTHPVRLEQETLSLRAWGQYFNHSTPRAVQKNILLGYSMGGRLAMHAIVENPSQWDACVFVSAHPGLSSENERTLRLQADLSIAHRFLKDPWESLLVDWNALPVFENRPAPSPRQEFLFDRNQLSRQLIHWSLGHQIPLIDKLKQASIPMLFIAGALDTKFCTLAEEYRPFAKVSIIPDAAHRVPWDQPEKFTNVFNTFIQELL